MGYDLYPMDTLAFKRAFLREAIEREYLIFFEHDPAIAAGYIRETQDGRQVRRAGAPSRLTVSRSFQALPSIRRT